jgi:molecular chaperone DnaK (HSP70)
VREGDRARGSRGPHARRRLIAHPRGFLPRALRGALPPSRARLPPSPPPGSRPAPLDRDDDALVGEAAARLRDAAPERTIYDAKRIIGRAFDDPDVADETAHLPFAVVPGPGHPPPAHVALPSLIPGDPPDIVSPEDVGARILAHLKRAAEASLPSLRRRLGFAFGSLTVSVPVNFDAAQRSATLRAANRAGFRVARLLEEPVAAAIAYGLHEKGSSANSGVGSDSKTKNSADRDRDRGRIVVVYDLGGGTLDVAVLRWESSARAFLVMATAGDPRLGGEDFDRALVGWLRDRLAASTDPSERLTPTLGDDPASREMALRAMERAKRTLARRESVRVRVVASREGRVARRIDVEPFEDEKNSTGGSEMCASTVTLTRAALAASCASLLDRSTAPVATALRRAGGVTVDEVDDVVMVGGSSRLVAVRERVREMFGDKVVTRALDPDTAIAVGAARSYAC